MVSMADQPITTSIDDLVKYLNEHGETDSAALSGALKVNESIIETWADVLEKAQIVRINYKLGKMFVSPMTITKEGVEVAKKTVELKKSTAESYLTTQVNMINQINAKLDEFKRYVAGAEGAFKSKAGEIKGTIDEIDKLSMQVDNAYRKLKDKRDFIDSLSAKLDKETQKLQEKADVTEGMANKESDVKRVISDIKAKLDDSESRIKTLNKNFDATVEANRQSFAELLGSIKDESKYLRETLNQQEKELREYNSLLSSYKFESESIKRQVSKERTRMVDEIAKSTDDARKVYVVADKQLGDAKKTLADLKAQFGGFSDLSDKLNSIKSNLNSLTKQKDELMKEIEQLGDQLKAIGALDSTRMAEKTMKMEQTDEKMTETAKKIGTLAKAADSVRNDIDEMAK
jgi:DNA repair exonuclease SbcCD ATPase subunit